MAEQMTEQEAIEFHESGKWGAMSAQEIVNLQLFQDRLCVPWDVFHGAIEEMLGRPVWTHEFVDIDLLRAEYAKACPAPTMEQIVEQLPKDKVIVCTAPTSS